MMGLRLMVLWRLGGARVRRAALAAASLVALGSSVLAADLPTRTFAPVPPLTPVDYGRFTVVEENAGLLPDGHDRHYTQGVLFGYLSPSLSPTDFPAQAYGTLNAGGALPIFGSGPG